MILTASGSVSQRLTYDPWGKRTDSNTALTSRQFTDHEAIPDIGLINMNARIGACTPAREARPG